MDDRWSNKVEPLVMQAMMNFPTPRPLPIVTSDNRYNVLVCPSFTTSENNEILHQLENGLVMAKSDFNHPFTFLRMFKFGTRLAMGIATAQMKKAFIYNICSVDEEEKIIHNLSMYTSQDAKDFVNDDYDLNQFLTSIEYARVDQVNVNDILNSIAVHVANLLAPKTINGGIDFTRLDWNSLPSL